MDNLCQDQPDRAFRYAQRTAFLLGSITAWIGFAKDGHVTSEEAVTEIQVLLDDHHAAQRADDERAEADR
ncbi:hypothetical protein GCM10009557_13820 [Virgisporangium ochraceum]|uniref:Uncharacterized protein n=1 Tax=Virgisporangium ochraceum TaxID=65505 RepID=A0A8J4A1P1_9ACTN|nr:hypothetical protein [Virgisporangium ochraceum]GIJ71256.1 hypothetical protein Voc01_061730 [Virgisporangium ochraceum]